MDNPSYHPGSLRRRMERRTAVGRVRPDPSAGGQKYDVDGAFYCAELHFDALLAIRALIRIRSSAQIP